METTRKTMSGWEDNIKIVLKEIWVEVCGLCLSNWLVAITLRFFKKLRKFPEWLSNCWRPKMDWASWTQLIGSFIIIYTGNENCITQWERNMFQFRRLCVLNNLIWIAAGWSSIRCTVLRKSFRIESLILRSNLLLLRNINELLLNIIIDVAAVPPCCG